MWFKQEDISPQKLPGHWFLQMPLTRKLMQWGVLRMGHCSCPGSRRGMQSLTILSEPDNSITSFPRQIHWQVSKELKLCLISVLPSTFSALVDTNQSASVKPLLDAFCYSTYHEQTSQQNPMASVTYHKTRESLCSHGFIFPRLF